MGRPVASSRAEGTRAEGKPMRLAGSTGRKSSMVAAAPSGEAAAKPGTNGSWVQVGDRTSGHSVKKPAHARAMPCRAVKGADIPAASEGGGEAANTASRKV